MSKEGWEWLTSDALRLMYSKVPDESYVAPQEQQRRVIKEMFILHLEEALISFEELTSSSHFSQYMRYYQKNLHNNQGNNVLLLPQPSADETLRIHNIHYIDMLFGRLMENARILKKKQYCSIKLGMSSGMTEYQSRMNLLEVHEFLKDIVAGTSLDAKDLMHSILEHLQFKWLYDREQSYTVGLALSSEKELHLLLSHESAISTDDRMSWYYYTLTGSLTVILDIIERHGYQTQGETIEWAFGPLIDATEDPEDEDEDSECV